MNKRFFGAALLLVGVAGSTVFFVLNRSNDVLTPGTTERAGTVEGSTVQARTLVLRTVNGETVEPVGNVSVQLTEQPSEFTQNRALVQMTIISQDNGIAIFRVPDGQYVAQSRDSEWDGFLTVRLTGDTDLYLTLRKTKQ